MQTDQAESRSLDRLRAEARAIALEEFTLILRVNVKLHNQRAYAREVRASADAAVAAGEGPPATHRTAYFLARRRAAKAITRQRNAEKAAARLWEARTLN